MVFVFEDELRAVDVAVVDCAAIAMQDWNKTDSC